MVCYGLNPEIPVRFSSEISVEGMDLSPPFKICPEVALL